MTTLLKHASASGNTRVLKPINDLLSFVAAGLILYILIAPILPLLQYNLINRAGNQSSAITAPLIIPVSQNNINTLIIPRLGLNEPIFEGSNSNTLDLGIWHRPSTSSPDLGSNTVLAGHRFTYTQGAIFYNLDKLHVDDEISLRWHTQTYLYRVKEIRIVDPTEMSVEKATKESLLTLYTCTPLWTDKQRLVVIAELER